MDEKIRCKNVAQKILPFLSLPKNVIKIFFLRLLQCFPKLFLDLALQLFKFFTKI